MSDIDRVVERIRAEYAAVPGLKITAAQACRLWTASEETCRAALEALVADHFLWLAPSGRYVALPGPREAVDARHLAVARCPYCQKRHTLQRGDARHERSATITLRCEACHRVFTFSAFAA